MIEIMCYICDRASGVIQSMFRCGNWEINRDYLTNEQSSFTVTEPINAKKGDFFVAKKMGNDKVLKNGADTGIKPFFLGVIDTLEDNTINVCDIYSIANFSIFVSKMGGNNIYSDVAQLLYTNILYAPTKKAYNLTLSVPTLASFYEYIPEEYPTTMTLLELMIELFRLWGITWLVDTVTLSEEDRFLKINTKIEINTKTINLKNNVYTFVNWEYYNKSQDNDNPNHLRIIDKNSDMYNPTILGDWFLTTGGEVQQESTVGVEMPTIDTVYIYDTTAENNPTQLEIAKSELSGNNYAHEISFEIHKDNKLINFDDLEIGLNASITYNGENYLSKLTGYTISSDSNFIKLKFGHIRSTFSGAIVGRIRKHR